MSVMDKRVGEHGKFQSRVDGMVGGGGGRGARVITREDNGLVNLQAMDWLPIRMTYL